MLHSIHNSLHCLHTVKYFQLALIEDGQLQLNTFVAIKLASDLQKATNLTANLYGADVLVTYDLIQELLKYESKVHGLNLTHSQDKDYINVSNSLLKLQDPTTVLLRFLDNIYFIFITEHSTIIECSPRSEILSPLA